MAGKRTFCQETAPLVTQPVPLSHGERTFGLTSATQEGGAAGAGPLGPLRPTGPQLGRPCPGPGYLLQRTFWPSLTSHPGASMGSWAPNTCGVLPEPPRSPTPLRLQARAKRGLACPRVPERGSESNS